MGFKRPTCWLKVGCPTTVLQPLGFQSNTTFNFFRISDTKMRLFQKIAQNLSIFLQRSCWLERFWKKFFWGEMFLYLTVATRVKHWGSERESEWVCVCVCVCERERERESDNWEDKESSFRLRSVSIGTSAIHLSFEEGLGRFKKAICICKEFSPTDFGLETSTAKLFNSDKTGFPKSRRLGELSSVRSSIRFTELQKR